MVNEIYIHHIASPLTNKKNVELVREIQVQDIVELYERDLNIDVKSSFMGLKKIYELRCPDSNLNFYFPFTIAGDGEFYSRLSKVSKKSQRYYSNDKWEHQVALEAINANHRILEIGAGNGNFLQKIHTRKATGVGLEINTDVIEESNELGFGIIDADIFEFGPKNIERFDIVCGFQLFEHVNQIKEFIEVSILPLKKGGKFIIGVPNNDSFFFKKEPNHTLNLPPHHMLKWNEKSLRYLAKDFPLKVANIMFEPSNANFKSYCFHLWVKSIFGANPLSNLIHKVFRPLVKILPVYQKGQTILAIFEKV